MNTNLEFDKPKIPLLDRILENSDYLDHFIQLFDDPEKLEKEVHQGDMVQKSLNITDTQMQELYETGHQYFQAGDYENAALYFLNLVLFDQKQSRYWCSFAFTCLALNHYEEALKGFQLLTQLEPENPNHYYFLADCLANLGKPQEALDACRLAQTLANADHQYSELRESIKQQLDALEKMGF